MRQLIRTRLRRALVGIPLSIVMVMMGVSLSGCASLGTMFQQTPAEKAAAAPKRVPTGAEKFANASDALTGSLEAAAKALKSGKRDAKALEGIAQFAKQLPELDKGVQADFAKTRGILKKIKSAEKDAIQAKVEKQYAERQKTLSGKLRAIASAESTAALKAAVTGTAKWLDDITPDAPYQPLGAELPHRIVNANAGPPVLGASIAPAYAPHLKGATPSTLPVTPTADDTTQTIEVQFTDDISSLVTSLGADPVRMYEYVRNTIDFEPYYGSRKGANETLLEGSGNDMDTASLLIALYRKAGIPARYVSGVVDVPIAKAMNWVGVETPEAAAKLFASGGTPTKTMVSGGRAKALRIEHTWAEAYVAYEDYRGAGAGNGPRRWVPLDASFKEYSIADLSGLRNVAAPMGTEAVASLVASSTQTEAGGIISGLDRHALISELETASAGEGEQALLHSPDFPTRIGGLDHSIVRRAIGGLPSKISLRSVAALREFVSPSDALASHLSVEINGVVLLDRPVCVLAGHTIFVDFVPAEQHDLDLVEAYGGIRAVPAYLVSARPQAYVDGVPCGKGDAVGFGETVVRTVTVSHQSGPGYHAANRLTAGQPFAVALNVGVVGPSLVQSVAERLQSEITSRGTVAQVEDPDHGTQQVEILSDMDRLAPSVLGPSLALAAMSYFMIGVRSRDMLAAVSGVDVVSQTSFGLALEDSDPVLALGVVTGLGLSGVSLDIQGDVEAVVGPTADAVFAYGVGSGMLGSTAESAVLETLFRVPAMSTTKVLGMANQLGIGIVRLASTDDLPRLVALPLSDAVKRDIEGAVRAGCAVFVPEQELQAGTWRGSGWLVVDERSGSVGSMIAGGSAPLAGGSTLGPAEASPSMVSSGRHVCGLGTTGAGKWGARLAEAAAAGGSGAAGASGEAALAEEFARNARGVGTIDAAAGVLRYAPVTALAVALVVLVAIDAYYIGMWSVPIPVGAVPVVLPYPVGNAYVDVSVWTHIKERHEISEQDARRVLRSFCSRWYWSQAALSPNPPPGQRRCVKTLFAYNPSFFVAHKPREGVFTGWFISIVDGIQLQTLMPLYDAPDPDLYCWSNPHQEWWRIFPWPGRMF